MPRDPHHCREHAKRCLRLAFEESTIFREQFEDLANRWLKLALELEDAAELEAGPLPRRRSTALRSRARRSP